MPEYSFECTKCQNVFESFQTIGHMIRLVCSPRLGDPLKLETTQKSSKPSNAFNDRLREIKKNYPGNKIEVRE